MNDAGVKLAVFDLDGTLAVSKSSVDGEMAVLLSALLQKLPVSVISGGMWSQFEKQLIRSLDRATPFERLNLFPTCGACFYRFSARGWEPVYREELSPEEKRRIFLMFERALRDGGYVRPAKTWGEIIEDRGTQVTFSGLGQAAPPEAKREWDPDTEKRKRVREILVRLLPDFEVRLGGMTSIDVTRRGIDKGYGIAQMEKHLTVPRSRMVFVGDALYPGGNDYAALEAGVGTVRAVSGPAETKAFIRELLDSL